MGVRLATHRGRCEEYDIWFPTTGGGFGGKEIRSSFLTSAIAVAVHKYVHST